MKNKAETETQKMHGNGPQTIMLLTFACRGTAAITLSALLAAVRATGERLEDQRVLFMGAGKPRGRGTSGSWQVKIKECYIAGGDR